MSPSNNTKSRNENNIPLSMRARSVNVERLGREMSEIVAAVMKDERIVERIGSLFPEYKCSPQYTSGVMFQINTDEEYKEYEKWSKKILCIVILLTSIAEKEIKVVVKGGKSLQLYGIRYPSDDIDVIIGNKILAEKLGELMVAWSGGRIHMKEIAEGDRVVKLSIPRTRNGKTIYRAICDIDFTSEMPQVTERIKMGRMHINIPEMSYQYSEAVEYIKKYEAEEAMMMSEYEKMNKRNTKSPEAKSLMKEYSLVQNYLEKFKRKEMALREIVERKRRAGNNLWSANIRPKNSRRNNSRRNNTRRNNRRLGAANVV